MVRLIRRALPAPGKDRLETLKARVEKKPESTQLLSELGDAYFEVKQFREAIPIYARVAELNPQDADAHNDLGLSLFYTGAREEGLASVTKAIEADPTYKHAWLSMGFILLSMERYQEAKAPLKKVKELDPGGRLARSADEFLEMIDEAGDP